MTNASRAVFIAAVSGATVTAMLPPALVLARLSVTPLMASVTTSRVLSMVLMIVAICVASMLLSWKLRTASTVEGS